jgi:hypothetical protein
MIRPRRIKALAQALHLTNSAIWAAWSRAGAAGLQAADQAGIRRLPAPLNRRASGWLLEENQILYAQLLSAFLLMRDNYLFKKDFSLWGPGLPRGERSSAARTDA